MVQVADHPEHGHTHDEADEIIMLLDEEGNEHEFALLDVIEVDGNEYAILIPAGEGEDDEADEAVILRMEQDESGNESLVDIEDEDEFNRVAAAWEELLEEDGDEDDEDEDQP